MFYEENHRKGNYKAFGNLLFNEDFKGVLSEQQIWGVAKGIIEDERKYSSFLYNLTKTFGYNLDLNSPYILGYGSESIIYNISKNGQNYIMKFIYGDRSLWAYSHSLEGQSLIEDAGLGEYIPRLHLSIYEPDTQTFEYVNTSNEKDSKTHVYGIIIQDYAGPSLETLRKDLTPSHTKDICSQLTTMKNLFLSKGIAHEDLHEGNITINKYGRVQFIDLEEVSSVATPPVSNTFEKLDYLMADLCI